MTRWASPNSAKAHLNYAVMLGARGHREARLKVGERALQIAPSWPMAHVYHADALCRLGRSDQAWPHYVRGWKLAPNDKNLVALGLQCLWDKGQFERRRTELQRLGDAHPDTWLDYLIVDVLRHGKDQGGVRPKDRPRAYDQGPKT
jgi:tetratricopeptide (TPR) repeat protein